MAEEISSDINVNQRNHSWVVDVDEKLKNMPTIPEKEMPTDTKSTNPIICKVPATVRERHCDSYTPFMVSFGPYHHGHQSCVRTQNIKELVLLYSLRRSKKTIANYVKAFSGDFRYLIRQYDELDPSWQQDDDAFLQLMIYDGCYFLEILREASNLREANSLGNNYHTDNPVCNMGISLDELMRYYRHDMLLLENQLPISLLYNLLAVQTGEDINEAEEYLHEHLLRFFFPTATKIPRACRPSHVPDLCKASLLFDPKHQYQSRNWSRMELFILGVAQSPCCSLRWIICGVPMLLVYGICYCLFKFLRYPFKLLRYLFKTPSPSHFHFSIPSATDLKNVGIGFSTSKSTSLMDISVGRRAVRLPVIYVDDATKSMLLNIIAFERLHQYVDNDVTSYIYFMSSLLQGVNDVKLLKLHGIIRTELSNDEVFQLFNSMAKGIFRDPKTFLVQKYIKEGRKLRELFNKMSNEWQMDLWQKYLRSPCAIISLIGAFLLFCLTTIQTIYTVLGYYNPK